MKLNIYRLIFTIVLFFFAFILFVAPAQAASPADKYRGATLVSRNSTDPSSEQWKQTLRELKANNINLVTYVLLYRQADIHTSQIYTSANNPTDASLIEGIQYAHSLGLHVQLKPHVDNDDVPTYWRGQINPTDKAAWFSNYGKILKHITDIARQNNVEEICIGTELITLSVPQYDPQYNPANTNYWKALISDIRANYNGTLTYSAIFTGELDQIEFWPQLDYIGISGYWQLSSQNNPSVAQLLNSWDSINNNILQPLARRENKPIVLTEVGYRSVDCATVYPWGAFYCGTGVNLNEQVNAYEALLSFWDNQPNLKGVILWGWEPNPQFGGVNDNSFSPQNKPVLQTLKKWFGGSGGVLPPPSSTSGVFDDNYQRDWTDWSWDANITVVDSPNSSGGKVLKMVTTNPWAGLRLNSYFGQQSTNLKTINFSISTTEDSQQYGMWLVDSNGGHIPSALPIANYLTSNTNGWKSYSIPLKDLGSENKIIKDIVVQDWSGKANSITYFDNIQFLGDPASSPSPSPSFSPSPSPSVSPSISPSPSPSFSPASGTTLTANPNPCYIASGTKVCTSRISWSVANPIGDVRIRIKETNGLFAMAPYGSQDAPWINETPIHFDLYDGTTLLNSIAVSGITKLGQISASPNPCTIKVGENICRTTISWSTINPTGIVQIRVRETNGLFAQAPNGSQDAPWASQTPVHMDLYDGNTLLDTVVIEGKSLTSPSPSPSPSPSLQPQSGQIYNDSLASGWVNWSWDALIDLGSSIFHKGTKAISFKATAVWAGLRIHNDAGIDTTSYTHLEFSAKAMNSEVPYGLMLFDNQGKQIGQSLPLSNYGGLPPTDTFKTYSIPLSDFGPKGVVKDIIIQDWSGKNDSSINIDEISFKKI